MLVQAHQIVIVIIVVVTNAGGGGSHIERVSGEQIHVERGQKNRNRVLSVQVQVDKFAQLAREGSFQQE